MYRKACRLIEWPKIFPELKLSKEYSAVDLLDVDVCVIIQKLLNDDGDGTKYGFLPYMATHSRASVGSLLASSFAERINSAANLILTKGNTLLSPEEIDMCTTLRINRDFMKFMRMHYPAAAEQQFNMTVISES